MDACPIMCLHALIARLSTTAARTLSWEGGGQGLETVAFGRTPSGVCAVGFV